MPEANPLVTRIDGILGSARQFRPESPIFLGGTIGHTLRDQFDLTHDFMPQKLEDLKCWMEIH